MAVRIVVGTVDDCYRALAVVHARWRTVSGQFDDYISSPKSNNYQSIHTALSGPGGKPFEVQIRTEDMHREAELGVAAHWRYKEGHLGQEDLVKKLAWVRQVLEWQEDLETAAPFVDILKADIFGDQVLVFTPQGEVIDLPRGATPLDFAYRIHTEVGHGCIGARVNGRLVPLKRELESGDTVEILTSKSGKGPSRDWLTIVQTGYARNKVRRWFKRQEQAENEEFGRTLLNEELDKIGHEGLAQVAEEDLQRVMKRLSFSKPGGIAGGDRVWGGDGDASDQPAGDRAGARSVCTGAGRRGDGASAAGDDPGGSQRIGVRATCTPGWGRAAFRCRVRRSWALSRGGGG